MTTLRTVLSRFRRDERGIIVCYSPQREKYRVAWSRIQGPEKKTLGRHRNATIDQPKDKLPVLLLGDHLILVETFVDCAPLWNVGIDDKTSEYFALTRPRFAQLKWQGKDNWVCPTE